MTPEIPIERPDLDAQIVSVIGNLEFYRGEAVLEARRMLGILRDFRDVLEANLSVAEDTPESPLTPERASRSSVYSFFLNMLDSIESKSRSAGSDEKEPEK